MSCSNKILKIRCGFKARHNLRVGRGGQGNNMCSKVVLGVSEGWVFHWGMMGWEVRASSVLASFRVSWRQTPTQLRAAGGIKKRASMTWVWAVLIHERGKYRQRKQNVAWELEENQTRTASQTPRDESVSKAAVMSNVSVTWRRPREGPSLFSFGTRLHAHAHSPNTGFSHFTAVL